MQSHRRYNNKGRADILLPILHLLVVKFVEVNDTRPLIVGIVWIKTITLWIKDSLNQTQEPTLLRFLRILPLLPQDHMDHRRQMCLGTLIPQLLTI